ncbi:MAG: phosphotransferase [Sphingopyxis sp.]|nr:phosphotransferase [Sphingopyxis sp.]
MDHETAIASFPFDSPDEPVSLYAYAPVLRVRDRKGDWVLKQTGLVHSTGTAIGEWLTALQRLGVDVVAPAGHFAPNPRRLEDGKEWVVYPFIAGTDYRATDIEIASAGHLLGKMHAADPLEAHLLVTHEKPVVRTAEWVEQHLIPATAAMRDHGIDTSGLEACTAARMAHAAPVDGLPLAGCSFDFKASNLVFGPKPTLVDPDHAARMPRLYDLAVALLLFHCDLPSAPGQVWTDRQWRIFVDAYQEQVTITSAEIEHWGSVLTLAWLDQAVWLLGNWPEGWVVDKDRQYLADLANLDLGRFLLLAVP